MLINKRHPEMEMEMAEGTAEDENARENRGRNVLREAGERFSRE